MKWLDRLFSKIWWSLHPEQAASMQFHAIQARLDYPMHALDALIELTDDPGKKKEYWRQQLELMRKAYGLPGTVTKQ